MSVVTWSKSSINFIVYNVFIINKYLDLLKMETKLQCNLNTL